MHAESAQKRRGSESAPLCDVTMHNKQSRNSRMRNRSVSLTGTEAKPQSIAFSDDCLCELKSYLQNFFRICNIMWYANISRTSTTFDMNCMETIVHFGSAMDSLKHIVMGHENFYYSESFASSLVPVSLNDCFQSCNRLLTSSF